MIFSENRYPLFGIMLHYRRNGSVRKSSSCGAAREDNCKGDQGLSCTLTKGLHELTASEIAAAVSTGRTTCEAVVRACLDRIAAREGEVQAWAYLDPDQAIAAARAFDGGGTRGPLAGVPFGVKDIIDTADMPTEWGTPIHRGRRSERDAACVALTRKAGGDRK